MTQESQVFINKTQVPEPLKEDEVSRILHFLNFLDSLNKENNMRKGQILMNALYYIRPDMQQYITGTHLDCWEEKTISYAFYLNQMKSTDVLEYLCQAK